MNGGGGNRKEGVDIVDGVDTVIMRQVVIDYVCFQQYCMYLLMIR